MRKPPFAVVSTGTWVVSMAVGGREVALDPMRDTLVNVNAYGDPIPSARFMGGREFELLMGDTPHGWEDSDMRAVLSQQVMVLPSVQYDSGPYPHLSGDWAGPEPQGGQRLVAASFYLALMTATCLALIGAEGEIIVEGPFATNEPYLAMLAAATGRPIAAAQGHATGTSIGAALLAGKLASAPCVATLPSPRNAGSLRSYAKRWRAEVVGVGEPLTGTADD